ncbi:hypothetical protein [Pararhodobacter sp. CCB-MM2]|uniref:hypothetical protein n=1 Tax=Pararhodobacter sp. CCB-MM2 TaxID=1786003 RepID=UPI0009F2DEEF|nr:hypothetical protein [Pararhodobacter sp. CCB-MM2]
MQTTAILVVITILTLIGDYSIKLASNHASGLKAPAFFIGALLYGIPAIGWFFLMRTHSLAEIGVFYSAATLILLAGLGFFVFREPLGWREILGLVLALAAVLVMQSGPRA